MQYKKRKVGATRAGLCALPATGNGYKTQEVVDR